MVGKFGLVAALAFLLSLTGVSLSHADGIHGAVKIGGLTIIIGPKGHPIPPHNHPHKLHRDPARKCVAVARTRRGTGKRIRHIRAAGFGRGACRKAMVRCWQQLDDLQATGRNPFASCVVRRRASRY